MKKSGDKTQDPSLSQMERKSGRKKGGGARSLGLGGDEKNGDAPNRFRWEGKGPRGSSKKGGKNQ